MRPNFSTCMSAFRHLFPPKFIGESILYCKLRIAPERLIYTCILRYQFCGRFVLMLCSTTAHAIFVSALLPNSYNDGPSLRQLQFPCIPWAGRQPRSILAACIAADLDFFLGIINQQMYVWHRDHVQSLTTAYFIGAVTVNEWKGRWYTPSCSFRHWLIGIGG